MGAKARVLQATKEQRAEGHRPGDHAGARQQQLRSRDRQSRLGHEHEPGQPSDDINNQAAVKPRRGSHTRRADMARRRASKRGCGSGQETVHREPLQDEAGTRDPGTHLAHVAFRAGRTLDGQAELTALLRVALGHLLSPFGQQRRQA